MLSALQEKLAQSAPRESQESPELKVSVDFQDQWSVTGFIWFHLVQIVKSSQFCSFVCDPESINVWFRVSKDHQDLLAKKDLLDLL